MMQVLQPILAPVSSPVWYEDFVSTTQPLNDSSEASVSTSPVHANVPPVEQPTQANDSSFQPKFEPVFASTSNNQETSIRKSSRVTRI